MKNEPLIIGLTGRFGAGCTTTSEFFVAQLGFDYFSLSESLKSEAKKTIKGFNGKPQKEKREILQDLGNEKRMNDASSLAKPIIEQIKKKKIKNVVIDSIRNPAELIAFRKEFDNLCLVAIDAEVETRFGRLKNIYKGDRSLFDKDDDRDKGKDEPGYGQQVKACIEMSDILINNEANYFSSKGKQRSEVIDNYGQKLADYHTLMCNPGNGRRPNQGELYMHFASSVALKSNCLRRQVGAILVHEKVTANVKDHVSYGVPETYVVATGCNNVPIGESDCIISDRRGCYMKTSKKEHYKDYLYCRKCGEKLTSRCLKCNACGYDNSKAPGKLLDICRAVHAEEAAILQASKLGIIYLDCKTLYTATFRCMLCCKSIINCGIKKIVYLESYPMEESQAL